MKEICEHKNNPLMCPICHPMTQPTTQTGMEKRFYEKFVLPIKTSTKCIPQVSDELRAFIHSEITTAVEAERARIRKAIKNVIACTSCGGSGDGSSMGQV